jgi:glycosyltransferase involved in cell wall biosynthesis
MTDIPESGAKSAGLTFSVVTPSYNQGQFLGETIDSVVPQKREGDEYLVIDGGSKDDSVEVIQSRSAGIDHWVSEKDKGQSEAINKGLRRARGDIVCWINSDDVLMPWALDTVRRYFEDHPEVMIVNGYTVRIDKVSRLLYTHFVPRPLPGFARQGIYYINQPSMFWRRTLHDTIGYLDESLHTRMDQEFVMRIFKAGHRFGKIDEVLAAIRLHEDTKTAGNSPVWEKDRVELERRYPEFRLKATFAGLVAYGFCKSVKGDYLRQFLFSRRWKGRTLAEFHKAFRAR